MILVRLKQEGREGDYVQHCLLTKIMWKDMQMRLKKLGKDPVMTYKDRLMAIDQYGEEYRAAILSYDEGILSDDKVLACAVWRAFFQMQCDDPEKIEKVVWYIRKQMRHLDRLDSHALLKTGLVPFLPFHGDELEDKEVLKEKFRLIVDNNPWIW